MVQLNDMRVLKLMADVTNLIAEGEVMQLVRAGDPIRPASNTSTSSRERQPFYLPLPVKALPCSAMRVMNT